MRIVAALVLTLVGGLALSCKQDSTGPNGTITLVGLNPCNVGSPGNGCVIDPTVPNLFVTVATNLSTGSFTYQMSNVTAAASVTVLSNGNGQAELRWNLGPANVNSTATLQVCVAQAPSVCLTVHPNPADYATTITLVGLNPCNVGSPGSGCVIDPTVPNLFVTVATNLSTGSFTYQMSNVTAAASVTVLSNGNGQAVLRWNLGPANVNLTATLQVCVAQAPSVCLTVHPNPADYATGPTGWSQDTTLSSGGSWLWGSSASNIFALTGTLGSIAHFDGTHWTLQSSGTGNGLNGIWGVSATSVYASGGNFAGTTNIQHYDGTSWTSMSSVPSCQYISGIWGQSDNSLFAVCTDGQIFHYNGTVWSAMTSPTSGRFEHVWGASDGAVFAIGDLGLIARYDGSSWTLNSSGTTAHLGHIWGSSASDVFVTGTGGVLLHFDGTSWSTMATGTTQNLAQVWGTSPSNVITVGANGTILRFNGASWAAMTSGTTQQLSGVWASAPTSFVVIAGNGLILRSH